MHSYGLTSIMQDRRLLFAAVLLALGLTSAVAGERRASAIVIRDERGRIVPRAPASSSGATVDVAVGASGFTFSPSTVNIVVGDTVRWTWFGSGHNVRSGTPCSSPDGAFCSINDTNCTANPLSNSGTTYSHTFGQAGTFQYYCSAHCGSGMKGTVVVDTPFVVITSIVRAANGDVTILGQTLPNLTIHIESSPDLVTTFGNGVPVTANETGGFSFTDSTALSKRFYRAVYP
jgi:plastocyanin